MECVAANGNSRAAFLGRRLLRSISHSMLSPFKRATNCWLPLTLVQHQHANGTTIGTRAATRKPTKQSVEPRAALRTEAERKRDRDGGGGGEGVTGGSDTASSSTARPPPGGIRASGLPRRRPSPPERDQRNVGRPRPLPGEEGGLPCALGPWPAVRRGSGAAPSRTSGAGEPDVDGSASAQLYWGTFCPLFQHSEAREHAQWDES